MKEVSLTRGLVALVDDQDYERVSAFTWHANEKSKGAVYAARKQWHGDTHKYENIAMHRFILGVVGNYLEIDHINGNRLDNRRANLRPCTHKNNMANRRTNKDRAYKGVINVKRLSGKPWRAYITEHGKFVSLGYFASPQEAARAYDAAARRIFGAFAALNFPTPV